MRYSNGNYSSNRSKLPEIEKGSDEVAGADRNQINRLLSELGVDATAEEVLDGAETVDVTLGVQLDRDYAKDYWKATVHNDEVLAKQVTVGFNVEGAGIRDKKLQRSGSQLMMFSACRATSKQKMLQMMESW